MSQELSMIKSPNTTSSNINNSTNISALRRDNEVDTSFDSYNLSSMQNMTKYKNQAWLGSSNLHKIDEHGTPHFNYPPLGIPGMSDSNMLARSAQVMPKAGVAQQEQFELPQVQIKRQKDKKKGPDHGGLIFMGATAHKKGSKVRRAMANAVQPEGGIALPGPGGDASNLSVSE